MQDMYYRPPCTSQCLLALSATSQRSVQLNCIVDLFECFRIKWNFVLRSMRWPFTSAFSTHYKLNRLSTFSFDEAHIPYRAIRLRVVNLCYRSGTVRQG